jgi:hypothetical protein
MKVGFNTNIPYKGKTYHVQTEDCGIKNPVVMTLLYHDGAILASKKTSYGPFLGNPEMGAKVQELMKLQHKIMIKELISGRYTAPPPEEVKQTEGKPPEEREEKTQPAKAGEEKDEPEGKIKDSLDDVLLDFILKKHKGAGR